METIAVSKNISGKILEDTDVLVRDREELNQEEVVKARITDIEANLSIGKSEQELDEYLKKRSRRSNF